MSYAVKSLWFTLQGEGAHAGRPAVFVRFTGCNLWSGREEGRRRAICKFCDTDFLGVDGPGGGHFACARALAATARRAWPAGLTLRPLVVLTGGEPTLQLDDALVDALHDEGFEIALETNGTRQPPAGVDWITVSPKLGSDIVMRRGNELKLVFPQIDGDPARFADWDFDSFLLQPMDGPNVEENTRLAAQYCLENPRWRVSVQLHKLLGIA